MWYDATVAAGSLEDPKVSKVVGKNGYAPAPVMETPWSGWLWAWSLAIPKTAKDPDAAWEFVSWATSKEYIRMVGERLGWERVPPGSRLSTYEIPEFIEAGKGSAEVTLDALKTIDPNKATKDPVPYTGHPVRADPGVPGSRHEGVAAVRRRARRQQVGRGRAEDRPGGGRGGRRGRIQGLGEADRWQRPRPRRLPLASSAAPPDREPGGGAPPPPRTAAAGADLHDHRHAAAVPGDAGLQLLLVEPAAPGEPRVRVVRELPGGPDQLPHLARAAGHGAADRRGGAVLGAGRPRLRAARGPQVPRPRHRAGRC